MSKFDAWAPMDHDNRAAATAAGLAARATHHYQPPKAMTDLNDRSRGGAPPIELLRGASLFLDFDGTLVDIAPRPDAVRVDDGLAGLLSTLDRRLHGRLGILTGRSVADIEGLLGPLPVAIRGHHGLETRGSGAGTARRPVGLDAVVASLKQLERDFPGVLVEDKPLGVALHYRQAPHAEDACRAAVEAAAGAAGLAVQPGKMVFELKPPGADKGEALKAMMAQAPFKGSSPVFIGDDLTDEPAFAAAQALGGTGIIVGDREPSCARYRLGTVGDVLAWLGRASGQAQ